MYAPTSDVAIDMDIFELLGCWLACFWVHLQCSTCQGAHTGQFGCIAFEAVDMGVNKLVGDVVTAWALTSCQIVG